MCVAVSVQVQGSTSRKFVPDGLCFLSKVGADGICCEEALEDV